MYSVNAPSKARKCRSNGVSFTLRQLWHLLASFPGHVAWPGNEAKSKLSLCDWYTHRNPDCSMSGVSTLLASSKAYHKVNLE